MSMLDKFLALYQRSGLRGSDRLINFLAARMTRLQNLPIETKGGILYGDLRISSARAILAYPQSLTGEDLVIERFVGEGDVVFDIGAHLGFYTLLMSQRVGEKGSVIAFEPNPELLPSLSKTISTIGNIHLHRVGLSHKAGTFELYVPDDASMGSLRDWTNGIGGSIRSIHIRTMVLDDMFESGIVPLPRFIKCDVEGAELSIFMGARKILDRSDAPVLLFELNQRAATAFESTPSDYLAFLASLTRPNYEFFSVARRGIKNLVSCEFDCGNVVAIPRERMNMCLLN